MAEGRNDEANRRGCPSRHANSVHDGAGLWAFITSTYLTMFEFPIRPVHDAVCVAANQPHLAILSTNPKDCEIAAR